MENSSKSLTALLDEIVDCSNDIEIKGISLDSRAVQQGYLFIGVPGVGADGRQFVAAALEQGAVALLLEAGGKFELPVTDVPVLRVDNLKSHVGLILNRFYDFPSSRIKVIGVTGTNGKTTCTQLLSQALDRSDRRCAVIGTLGNGYPGALSQGTHTTPDVVSMYKLLADFAEQGAYAVCIEVSSHALEQGRVDGIEFDIAVFTNLTRDHLDYHGDMESYAAAKSKLFLNRSLECAVINIDDAYGRQLREQVTASHVTGFGLRSGDVHAENIQATPDGMSFTLVSGADRCPVNVHLYGEFNISNLLAVASVLIILQWTLADIADAFSGLVPVPGRMERFAGTDRFPVIVVDYAHTPDALKHALEALRPHTRGELWCVFGCGGDRDRGKRPLMGAIADELADHVVLTDDNPRTESAEKIIHEIESGMVNAHQVIQPRERAVRKVIKQANVNDLILLAGKGHEDYQEIGRKRVHYSDRELVQQVFGEVA